MIVASGLVKAPDGFGAEAQRMSVNERIGAGGCTYAPAPVQPGSATVAETERGKVHVIKRIGAGGSTYSSSRPKTGVIECLAAEGIVYRYSQPSSH